MNKLLGLMYEVDRVSSNPTLNPFPNTDPNPNGRINYQPKAAGINPRPPNPNPNRNPNPNPNPNRNPNSTLTPGPLPLFLRDSEKREGRVHSVLQGHHPNPNPSTLAHSVFYCR